MPRGRGYKSCPKYSLLHPTLTRKPRLEGIPYLRSKHKEKFETTDNRIMERTNSNGQFRADRPERRTALVARELARYHVDIAALIETRRANEGQLTEDGGGYCFFWSGRSNEERREAGVGFAIRSHLISTLESLPKCIIGRLMVMQLQLTNKHMATLISAYATTMTNPEEVKYQLYEQLDTRSSPKVRKTHHPWRLQWPSRNGPPHMIRSHGPTRYRQMQHQWPPTPTDLYCLRTCHH